VDFENVGGEVMDAVLCLLNIHARVALCGMISTYNATGDWWSPKKFHNIIMKRARIAGFLISDYIPRFPQGIEQLARWVREGHIKYHVDILDGIERAPEGLMRLFSGANLGKQLVRVFPEPAQL
jgi:NADPH-dependent curcumin reductase